MKLPFLSQYFRLPQHDVIESLEGVPPKRRTPVPKCTKWFPWVMAVCLLLLNSYTYFKLRAFQIDKAVYSPAASEIRYKNVLFTSGVEDEVSPYQGYPTEQNNQLWEDLYSFGVNRIPKSEAVLLHNQTSPIVRDPGYYIIILEVFHELHCLNMLRKRLYWNNTSPPPHALSVSHLDHCIDLLRQSVMCSSDITPIPYAWYPKYQEVSPTMGITHTCRDFGAIQNWAKKRQTREFNRTDHVEEVVHIISEA